MKLQIKWSADDVRVGERLRFHNKSSGERSPETYIVVYQHTLNVKGKYNIVSLQDGMIYLPDFTDLYSIAETLTAYNAVPASWIDHEMKTGHERERLHSAEKV